MKEITIEELAYFIKQAKDNNQPQPIFFLGAGASKTGGIPLANEICQQILKDYSDNPFIKKLKEEDRSYAKLMECLWPNQRNVLLKGFINDAKINVTHIYLAQLLIEGFVDYVLTVNFDNLMLRALALYNEFPPTYDMAVLNDLTTSTFNEKSVVYLHGQHHGLWLLNTESEMEKVRKVVPRILDTIKNKRPWIFIGYSGNDPVFEHIKNLGRFDNGLYWVGYNDYSPSKEVQKFLERPNTHAHYIKGYDADAFMLKLSVELGVGQPPILDKPFSVLREMLNEIKDVDDEEHFVGVKERLKMSIDNVQWSIDRFENGKAGEISDKDLKIKALMREIIEIILSQEYDLNKINELENRILKIKDSKLIELLSILYSNWALDLASFAEICELDSAINLYQDSIRKYQRSIELNSDNYLVYSNFGAHLSAFAKLKLKSNQKDQAKELLKSAILKFSIANKLKSDSPNIYYNWGNALVILAGIQDSKEAEKLFHDAFEKYRDAIFFKPKDYQAYYNWGDALIKLAIIELSENLEDLIEESIVKFKRVIEITGGNDRAYHSWGTALGILAEEREEKDAQLLLQESIKKFEKASSLNPNSHKVYNSWGNNLKRLSEMVDTEKARKLLYQAIEKHKKAIEINPSSGIYCNLGISLASLALINGNEESEKMFYEGIDKFEKALEIKPDYYEAYNNWGMALITLAEQQNSEELYLEGIEKYTKAFELGGRCYILACLYANINEEKKAFKYLNISLESKEVNVEFVLEDEDWKDYLQDPDFLAIIEKHQS